MLLEYIVCIFSIMIIAVWLLHILIFVIWESRYCILENLRIITVVTLMFGIGLLLLT